MRANRPPMSFSWSMVSLVMRLEDGKDVTAQVLVLGSSGKGW